MFGSRLQKPAEADCLANHPLFIGLVSQLLDSVDRDDIVGFIRRLTQKGTDILHPPKPNGTPKLLFSGRLRRAKTR